MPNVVRVDDASDPRLADYVDLNDPALRRRVETAGDFFVAEGPLVVRRLLDSRCRVRSVLLTEPQLSALHAEVAKLEAPVYVAPEPVLRRVVGFDLHRGAVAAADRFQLPDPRSLLVHARTVVVLERVNDHENLGVIFRSAMGLFADAVLLCPQCSDPLYRRSVRVSMGAAFTLPFARLAPWPQSLGLVRDAGFRLLAFTPNAEAVSIRDLALERDERVALMLGSEGAGLGSEALAAADTRVRIPMSPGADSLNVATTTAIACHAIASARA